MADYVNIFLTIFGVTDINQRVDRRMAMLVGRNGIPDVNQWPREGFSMREMRD
jgi:hypothetical protein